MPSPVDIRNLVVQARESVVEERNKNHSTPTTDLLSPDLVWITILCARNPVFDAAHGRNSRFAEGQGRNNQLKFPDQLPQVIELFAR
jgi:hypothetical protein